MNKIFVLLMLIGGCTWTTYRPPLPPPVPQDCHRIDDRNVFYESNDAEECKTLVFQCANWEDKFFDDCGCGCVIIERDPFEGVL